MAKKVTKNNSKEVTKKKKDKKVEVLEEEIDMSEFDDEDFEDEEVVSEVDEDYDDEDFEDEEAPKTTKVKKVSSKEQSDLDLNRVMSIATLVISALALIISLIVLSKVSFIAKQFDDGKKESKVDSELNEEGSYEADYDTSSFKEISAEEFIDMIKDEDSKAFVYTGRPTCSYCTLMIGNLIKSVEDYDYTLYYLNTDNLDSDSTGKITELDEILEKDFPATPMVYLVGDGKVYDVNEGYTDYATYTKFLEDNDVEKR